MCEQASGTGTKIQPINLERNLKIDPKLNNQEKEAAIKAMLKQQFPDIVKDKIGGQKYHCFSNKCRKTFSILKQLFEHQKIHLKNYRPFECDFPSCNKSFMSKGHLRNHADTHKTQKNFVCPIQGCNESYNRQQRLKVHLKRHNGTKDFVCPFDNCKKAFYEKGNLKTHLRLHTGEKPYHCSATGCPKSFATQGHLNDHFMKNHQLGQQQPQKIIMGGQKGLEQPKIDRSSMMMMENQTIKVSQHEVLKLQASAMAQVPYVMPTQHKGNTSAGLPSSSQSEDRFATGNIAMKKRKILKINVKAANNVADEVHAYNAQSVPKIVPQPPQEELQKATLPQVEPQPQQTQQQPQKAAEPVANPPSVGNMRVMETNTMVHERPGSAGKQAIATDYMPFFFSFKDYEPKIGQKRGTQTCIKVENRTLNPPTPLKENREVHLDSNSQNQSQQSQHSQSAPKQEQPSETVVNTTQSLKQAFGVKTSKKKHEFVPPPAKTPLNPRQLAKRRFFNESDDGEQAENQLQDQSDNELPANAEESFIRQRRQNKCDEKSEKALRQAIKIKTHNSLSLKTVEEKCAGQSKQNSITGSGPTFDPRLNQGMAGAAGVIKTPSISQTSNVPDLKELGVPGFDDPTNKQAALFLQKRGQEAAKLEKASVLTFQEHTMSKQESIGGQVVSNSAKQPKEASHNLPSEAVTMTAGKMKAPAIPQYTTGTTTCVKQPQPSNSFFGSQALAQQNKEQKPFSCQKMPVRNEYAFFNPQALQSESKETPQMNNDCEASSLNLLLQSQAGGGKKSNLSNSIELTCQAQAMVSYKHSKNLLPMMSDVSQLGGSNLVLTPMQSQNQSANNARAFNFQQPGSAAMFFKQMAGQSMLNSPLISNNSNMMSTSQQLFVPQPQPVGTGDKTQAAMQQSIPNPNNAAQQARQPQLQQQQFQNFVSNKINNRSSSGSKAYAPPLTDQTPSSVRWDKSQFAISPISHNLSNPSVFFGNQQSHVQPTFKVPQGSQMRRESGALLTQQQHQQQQQQLQQPPRGQQVGNEHLAISTSCQTNLSLNHKNDLMLLQVDGHAIAQAYGDQQQMRFMAAAQQQQQQQQMGVSGGSNNANSMSNVSAQQQMVKSAVPSQLPSDDQNIALLSQNAGGSNTPQKSGESRRSVNQSITDLVGKQTTTGGPWTNAQPQPLAPEPILHSNLLSEKPPQLQGMVPNPELDSQGVAPASCADPLITANNIRAAKMQSIATQCEKEESESRSSSLNRYTQHQMELIKKKTQYQQKLQKIEYQIYVQNQKLMNKAIQMQTPRNFFFSEPVLPAESFYKVQNQTPHMMQQSPLIPSPAAQMSARTPQPPSWLASPWQRQQQQQLMMQQAALEKQSQQSAQMHGHHSQHAMMQQNFGPGSIESPQFQMLQGAPPPGMSPAATSWNNSQRPPSFNLGTTLPVVVPDHQQYQQMMAEQMMQQQTHGITPMRLGGGMVDPNMLVFSSLSSSSSNNLPGMPNAASFGGHQQTSTKGTGILKQATQRDEPT